MKNPIKSVLSCTLSLALCVCFLPASAFAVEEPAEPVTAGESPATNGDFSDAAAPVVAPSPSVAGEEGASTPENVAENAAEETSEILENGVALEANAEKESVVVTGTSKNGTDDSTACLWTLSENGGSVRIPVLDNDGNQIKDEDGNPKFEDKAALTLTIEPKSGSSGTLENWDISGEGGKPIAPPWIGKDDGAYVKQITHVEIGGSVTALTTREMFLDCINLKDITGLNNLDVSGVTNMKATFGGCSSLTSLDLSNWDTSTATTMEQMFAQCGALETITTSNTSGLITSEATNTSRMFENCGALKAINTTKWDTSKITDMTSMFSGCSSLTSLDLSSWTTSEAKKMRYLFYGCSSLETLGFPDTWKTKKVTDMTSMFGYCTRLRTISGLDKWETDNVTTMSESKLTTIDGKDYLSANGMFAGCRSLESLDGIAGWNVGKIANMCYMFAGCESLKSLSLPKREKTTDNSPDSSDIIDITNMRYLFYGCTSLETLDFPDTWKTKKVTDMTSMFGYCTRLRTISGLDKWETDSVVKTYERAPAIDFETGAPTGDFSDNGMFTGCKSLESVANLSEWDVSSMEDMSFMFFGCESLHDISALSGWTINASATMNRMFHYCPITTMKFGSGWQGKLSTDLFSIGSTATWDSGNNAEALTTGELIKKLNSGNGLDQAWHKWNTEGFVIEYIPDQLFTGKDITPVPKVTCNGKLLKQGTDYTVKYANNRDKGRATVTVTGNGAYYGEKTASFQIYKLDFKGAAITAPAPQIHTGKAVTPAIEVKYNGKLLKQGTDYTVKYANNTDVGTANFTVTGMGSYDGSQAYTFQIIPDPATRQVMYRAYNPNSGEHFYTASFSEVESVVAAGWTYEGEAWIAPVTSATPVYRLYSGTDHHYTTSKAEKDHLVSVGWRYEGVGWYSDDAKGTALHRLFNPNVNPTAPTNNSGSHHYTTSAAERDHLVSVGWRYEGHGWYGVE